MKKSAREYEYQGKAYEAEITRRRAKRIHVRYDPATETIKVSAPYLSSLRSIDDFVLKSLPKLLRYYETHYQPAYEDGEVYLFGEKVPVGELSPKKLNDYLRKKARPVFEARLRHYEALMDIPVPYNLRLRAMKTRFGVNSKGTHSITFSLTLAHYTLPVIDSVVVHELAHHRHFDHSDAFYEVVYRYCPEYKACRKVLIHHDYGTNPLEN